MHYIFTPNEHIALYLTHSLNYKLSKGLNFCMMNINDSLEVYFNECRIWYCEKYLQPLSQRSYIICIGTIMFLLLLGSVNTIYKLFPITDVLKYAVILDDASSDMQITITKADTYKQHPLKSISQILVENYVIQREEYDYNDLKKQLSFIKTNSSTEIFNQYYNFISINNYLSPVLRYQDQLTRSVEIVSTDFNFNDTKIIFRSIARDQNNKIQEQILWQANIAFQTDPIKLGQQTGTKFNFIVTSYKLKLLKNEFK